MYNLKWMIPLLPQSCHQWAWFAGLPSVDVANGQQMNNNNSSTYNSFTTKAGPQLKKLVITDRNKVKATSTCIQIPNKLKRTSWLWSTVRRSACTYRVTQTQSLTMHYDLSLHRKVNINTLHIPKSLPILNGNFNMLVYIVSVSGFCMALCSYICNA